MPTRLIVTLLACVAIAGCGSSSSSSKSTSTSAPPPATTSTSSAASGSGSGGVTIKAAGFAFNPTSVTVKKGQKVTWTNSDSAPHNVTSSDGTIKSKDFTNGQSFTYTATKAGTFHYICTIHPQMKATLIVTG
jgi:plastocyanin